MGIVCKDCSRPFLVWSVKFEGVNGEDENIPKYLDDGHTSEMIRNEVVGDHEEWCSCEQS